VQRYREEELMFLIIVLFGTAKELRNILMPLSWVMA
jgi:hypothetical protein